MILILVLLCCVCLSSYRIGEPVWEASHHGHVMSEYPHNALNYVRFGYLDTRLGLVTNYGENEPKEGFSYRVDHGILTSVLISFCYHVFGVHEWSARLIPVAASVGTSMVTAYLLLLLTNDRWTALAGLVFCSLSPMQTYYARLPAPHNVAVLFSVLAFYSYWRWFTTKRSGWLVGIFVALTIGVYTDWVAYFVVAPIVVHCFVFGERRKYWWVLVALILSPLLLFGFYVLWMSWLAGDRAWQVLWSVFLQRTGSSYDNNMAFTSYEVWRTFCVRSKHWLTTPVLILSLGWFVGFCWGLVHRQVSAFQGLILALYVFGFSHNLIFINRVMVHDFIMLYHLVPAFAMASASALAWIVARLQRITVLVTVAVAIVFSLFVKQSLATWQVEHSREVAHTQSYYVGRAINSMVSGSGSYIDAAEFYPHLVVRMYATADRAVRRMSTFDSFIKVSNDPSCEAIVVANSDSTDDRLRKYLTERYPRRDVSGYSIFELDRDGSNTVVENPSIQNPYRVRFGDQIEFLGFDIDGIVYRNDEQIGWVERYLNRHAELLPMYRTAFRVTNYWRKITEEPIDYTLITQFDAQNGHLYRLEQPYDGLDDLYPTTFWAADQIIREEMEIAVPANYPSLNYAMWIGVERDTGWYLVPEASQLADENGRVRVGQVYVRTGATDLSLESITHNVERPVDIRLDGGLSLIRFALSQGAVYPGDVLIVTLTWRAQTNIMQDYKVFVHLMDPEGQLVAQHDAEPDHWRWSTSQWSPGVSVRDAHPVLIPPDLPPGTYHIQVGMYLEATKERLSVLSASESVSDNGVWIGVVEVLPLDE